LKRISSLDGFRAISIIIVILGHLLDDARVCFHQHFVYQGYVNGGLGVFIFFVISGYLITYLLLRDFDKWEPIIFQVMEAVRRDPIRRSDHSLRLGFAAMASRPTNASDWYPFIHEIFTSASCRKVKSVR
jgi:hypothetical protein